MSDARSRLPTWAARCRPVALPGLSHRPSAAGTHLLHTLRATAAPAPPRVLTAERPGMSAFTVALAIFLAVSFVVCLAVLARIAWPLLCALGGSVLGALQAVRL